MSKSKKVIWEVVLCRIATFPVLAATREEAEEIAKDHASDQKSLDKFEDCEPELYYKTEETDFPEIWDDDEILK